MAFTDDFLIAPGLLAARPAFGVPGRIYWATDAQTLTYDTGAAWVPYSAVGGGGLYESYYMAWDEKANLVNGGGFTQGAWRTRDLSNEIDPDGIGALAANQIVLDAGDYRCIIHAPGTRVGNHKARLQNVTGAVTLVLGTAEYSLETATDNTTRSFVCGRFTVAGAQTLEVQHYCTVTRAAFGFGVAADGGGTAEIYTVAEFFKEA